MAEQKFILTPDQRLRVFVSSTLRELAEERKSARRAIERLMLAPVMFELGARPHPPRALYRAYLEQSHVFIGIYWQSYGWVAPDETVSGLEDEYNLSGSKPKLIYIKSPAPERESKLEEMLDRIRDDDHASYKFFETPSELRGLIVNDLMVLLSERFEATRSTPKESSDAEKHNLPALRSSFVGRQDEIREVKRALAATRLLTLTGAGGVGKTRLALEVARDLIASYRDGVWLVELGPLSEPELVPKAAAGALGVQERSGQPLSKTLVEAMRPKEMLLILDNCEHLLGAAARLADALLDTCPNLRILATSRETLDVTGETNHPLVPLEVLASEREPTVAELEGSESASLFLERARHRNPSFVLTPENSRAVAEVCWSLDGIPLAIELAAARVGTLSVEQIAERLRVSFALLSGGRTASARHRTLRAALDWSYELLGKRERTLFRRLCVFVGGWALDSAEIVATGEEVESDEVVDLLSALVGKSLVIAENKGNLGMRYRMLEPVRRYAQEKLEQSGEAEVTRRQHAAYFIALTEQEPGTFKGSARMEWVRRLEEEHNNLRTALSWSLESNEVELGLRLAGASQPFWARRGHYREGRSWLEAMLTRDGRASAEARAKALHAVGWLAVWQGDIDRAAAAAEDGLQLSLQAQTESAMGIYLRLLLGFTAQLHGDYEQATRLFDESLGLSRELGDGWCIAASLLHVGSLAGDRGDNERAVELYEDGIALCRKSGYAVVLADILNNLGYEYILRCDHERATTIIEESVAIYRNEGYRYARLEFPLDNLGWAALLHGDEVKARALHLESLAICRVLGNKLVAAENLEGLACAAAARGEAQRSARLFGAADALFRVLNVPHLPAEQALRDPYLEIAGPYKAEWEKGSKMTFEEAIEYALQEEQPTSSALPTLEQPSIEA